MKQYLNLMKKLFYIIPFAIGILANACTEEETSAPIQLSENFIDLYLEPDSIKVNKANTEGSLFHFEVIGTYYDKKGTDKSQIDPNGYIDPYRNPTNASYKARYEKLASEIGDTCYNKKKDIKVGTCLCDSLLKIEIVSNQVFAGKQPGENLAEYFKFYGYSPLEYIRNGYKKKEETIDEDLVKNGMIRIPFYSSTIVENAKDVNTKNSRFLEPEFYLYITEKSEQRKAQKFTFIFYFTQKTIKTTSTI